MAIDFVANVDGNTLLVKASGFDESLDQVLQYGLAIIGECQRSGVSRVLCDERDLEYRLNTLDIYESAAFIADHAPGVARVAIACNPRDIDDGRFWETVAANRGLTVRVFKDIESARSWLGGA